MNDTNAKDVYAPVTNRNDRYDENSIVEDGIDPIDDADEDAIAAIKGHIEKQDLEGRKLDGEESDSKSAMRENSR